MIESLGEADEIPKLMFLIKNEKWLILILPYTYYLLSFMINKPQEYHHLS